MTDELRSSRPAGVDADLNLMFALLDALRDFASDPEKARDSARVYDFSIRWGTMLSGRLERLAYYHGQGRLAPEEQARYDSLRSALREMLPLVKRLGLASPSVPLDDADRR
ncbi:MAG: hypothetical protein ACRDQ5_00885 [Sciscionella sp.]